MIQLLLQLLYPVANLEAIKLANDSEYGLGASIWTQDLDKAERLSTVVQSGIVSVNNVVISDPSSVWRH